MKAQPIIIVGLIAIVAILLGFIIGQNVSHKQVAAQPAQISEVKMPSEKEEVNTITSNPTSIRHSNEQSVTDNSLNAEKYSTDNLILPEYDGRIFFNLCLQGYDPSIQSGTVYTVGVMKVKTNQVNEDSVIYFTTPILQYVTSNSNITARLYDDMESCISKKLQPNSYTIMQRGYYASVEYSAVSGYLHFFKRHSVCSPYPSLSSSP